ncbi:MAG: hypothetical protein GWN47_03125 [Woeseiaceae bacterium]|nr:hypothetical protein [Woeseiaceae bacterium]
MRFEKFMVLVFVASLAGAVYAGEREHRQLVIAVTSDDTEGEYNFKIDSDDLGFDLGELQVGESRTVTNDSGQTVLVARDEDGFSFDVNGKTIRMPSFDDAGDFDIHIDGDHKLETGVHVVKHKIGGPDPAGGTVIVSGKPIDAATRDVIRTALQSAGHDGDVTFIDTEARADGEQQVKIIKRRVEVTK